MNPQEYFLPSLLLLFTVIGEIIADNRPFVNTQMLKILLRQDFAEKNLNMKTLESIIVRSYLKDNQAGKSSSQRE